jgi:tyrosyl-tRNA synthetase
MKRMETTSFDEDKQLNTQITSKMSKSVAGSGVIVHDEPDIIRKKLRSAYCPEKDIENNPVIEIARYIIFPWTGSFTVDRPSKYGGPASFATAEELNTEYRAGKLHPLDLKNAVAESLVKILEPVRAEFKQHPELLEKMEKMEITR